MEDTIHGSAGDCMSSSASISSSRVSYSEDDKSSASSSPGLEPSPPINEEGDSKATSPRLRSHARAVSVASPRHRKRLSLSFPVLPPGCESHSRHRSPITPSVSGASTPPDLTRVNPDDSATFLTALASQERRVLELREELSKAETELEKLKEQWMLHEAAKKRRELSLDTNASNDYIREALTSPTRREEYQRLQRAQSGRKVLPSQRHQRTLSLLSPDRGRHSQPFPQPDDVDAKSPPPLQKRHTVMNPPTSRPSAAGSSTHQAKANSLDMFDFPPRPKGQDVLLQTGKQIADDFKEGLWTFIEDLKQATVGDDPRAAGTPSTPQQQQRPPATSKSGLKDSEITETKDKEPEIPETPIQDQSDTSGSDTDRSRWSMSTTLSDPGSGVMTPPTQHSTPRSSTRSAPTNDRRSSLRRADTTRPSSTPSSHLSFMSTFASSTAFITPGQFKKHANALMSQVEKSFALPLPEPGDDNKKVRTSEGSLPPISSPQNNSG